MKKLVALSWCLTAFFLITGCTGTEIGNGEKPREENADRKTSTSEEKGALATKAAPKSSDSTVITDNAGPKPLPADEATDTVTDPVVGDAPSAPVKAPPDKYPGSLEDGLKYLMASCASPFSSKTAANFDNEGSILNVTEKSGEKTISLKGKPVFRVKAKADTVEAHDVNVVQVGDIPLLKNYKCSLPVRSAFSDTRVGVAYVVTTDEGTAEVSWQLENGVVVYLHVQNEKLYEEFASQK